MIGACRTIGANVGVVRGNERRNDKQAGGASCPNQNRPLTISQWDCSCGLSELAIRIECAVLAIELVNRGRIVARAT